MQFGVTGNTRVFLRTGPTDLRLGFEGLRSLVANVLRQEPTEGHLFVFCNRARNRVRCLFWDGSGLWVATKRLEAGTFDWPKTDNGATEVSAKQLQLLLEASSCALARAGIGVSHRPKVFSLCAFDKGVRFVGVRLLSRVSTTIASARSKPKSMLPPVLRTRLSVLESRDPLALQRRVV